MRLRLKPKIPLIIALLVLTVVGVTSWLHVLTLTRQVIQQADSRANLVAQQVFFQAQNALAEAANEGRVPASNRPEYLAEFVLNALDQNSARTSCTDAQRGNYFLCYD